MKILLFLPCCLGELILVDLLLRKYGAPFMHFLAVCSLFYITACAIF